MLCAVLNESQKQNFPKDQLYGHLPHISKTMINTINHLKNKNHIKSEVCVYKIPSGGGEKTMKLRWTENAFMDTF